MIKSPIPKHTTTQSSGIYNNYNAECSLPIQGVETNNKPHKGNIKQLRKDIFFKENSTNLKSPITIKEKISSIKNDLATSFIDNFLAKNSEISETNSPTVLKKIISSALGLTETEMVANAKTENISQDFKDQFIQQAIIAVSEAEITRILADGIHKQFISNLLEPSKSNWLTTFIDNDEFNSILEEVDKEISTPIKDKLTTILNFKDTSYLQTKYLSRIQEKIHFGVANRLMPDRKEVLQDNVFENFSISTIDGMFSWGIDKTLPKEDNYISLQLNHIKNIGLRNLIDQTRSNSFDNIEIKNQQIAIALITQTMKQTKDPATLVDFLISNEAQIILADDNSILKDTIQKLTAEKLTDKSFKEGFIEQCSKLYFDKSHNKLNSQQRECLLNTPVAEDLLKKLYDNAVYLNQEITKIDLSIIDNFSIKTLKQILNPETADRLFSLAKKAGNCSLMYKLLKSECCTSSDFFESIAIDSSFLLNQARKKGHLPLFTLLLSIPEIQIKASDLHYVITLDNQDENFESCMKHIEQKLQTLPQEQQLALLEKKNTEGDSALLVASCVGNHNAIELFLKIIINLDSTQAGINKKFELMNARGLDGSPSLYMLSFFGYENSHKTFVKTILSCDEFTNNQKIELLKAKNHYSTALYNLCDKGYTNLIDFYAKAILTDENFYPKEKFELLKGESRNGALASYAALKKGHTATFEVLISNILKYNTFTAEEKIELLEAKNHKGFLGFHLTFNFGHAEIVDLYTRSVMNTNNLTHEQKFKLLQSKNVYGTSALYAGYYKNKEDTHEVATNKANAVGSFLTNILAHNNLTVEEKKDLVIAQNNNVSSGLRIAFLQGSEEVISTVTSLILSCDDFNLKQKFEILKAIDNSGTPGLYGSFCNQHTNTVCQFTKRVLEYNTYNTLEEKHLLSNQKLELLQAKDNDGIPGLLVSFATGDTDTVLDFTKIILENNDFNNPQKINLLRAKDSSGNSGLSTAQENGHQGTIDAFKALVAEYNCFTTGEQNQLLKLTKDKTYKWYHKRRRDSVAPM
jgi:hypothetical protein